MTFREKLEMEYPGAINPNIRAGADGCPSSYGYEEPRSFDECCMKTSCKECWDREIPETKIIEESSTITQSVQPGKPDLELKVERKILDSGNRRQFESGAVRDIQEGKGRCDLLPLDVVAGFLGDTPISGLDMVFLRIRDFMEEGDVSRLYQVLTIFNEYHWDNPHTLILEISKHFEEGAKKYGENNWQKGIPVHCYIDSAVRHYLKFLRGDKDEPHDRAFCWNIMCAIWTCKHKPELNEYDQRSEFLRKDLNVPQRDYDPVARAYDIAKTAYNGDHSNIAYALEEIVGYLGEALE